MQPSSSATSKSPTSNNIGNILCNAIKQAKQEQRIVIGLSTVIKYFLKKQSDVRGGFVEHDVILCVLVSTQDHVGHMQNTLLQAYCNEHHIDIVRVDSAEKLTQLLDVTTIETCVLILCGGRTEHGRRRSSIAVTGAELALVNYCDQIWSSGRKQSITLPEMLTYDD